MDRARDTTIVRTAAVCLVMLIAMGGCAVSGERFSPVVATEIEGVIYIYRSTSTFAGSAVTVFVDGDEVSQLKNGEFVARVVDAGEHFVRVYADAESTIAVRVIEGESAYVQIRVSQFGSVPRLIMPDSKRARKEISRTRVAAGAG